MTQLSSIADRVVTDVSPPPSQPKSRGRGRAVAALGFSQAVDNSEGGIVNSFSPLIRNAFGLDYGADEAADLL